MKLQKGFHLLNKNQFIWVHLRKECLNTSRWGHKTPVKYGNAVDPQKMSFPQGVELNGTMHEYIKEKTCRFAECVEDEKWLQKQSI